ncbi:hypothetical protein [Gilliamella sp. BG6]|uniref:hypothetical protein n=1 Tax=unclassified Gilliamella TaxID=2685620 RepID=UPI0039862C74
MRFLKMQANKVFNHLLHLSGLVEQLDIVVELMNKAGYQVSISQIRDWRRNKTSKNYRAVPDFALDVLFDYLFEQKRKTLRNN